MDRVITQIGAIPRSVDVTATNRNTMIALGVTLQAVLGTNTLVDGLACNPTAPASMQVSIGPGSIMSVGPVDATAYGALPADTTDQIMKQGIQLGSQLLTLTAPSTSGYSQNYLVAAAFVEVDAVPLLLQYYNPLSPANPLNGPGGNSTPQNTVRQGQVLTQLIPGVAAPAGSQATPAAPAGMTPLYVITVTNGQTTITSGNIAVVAGAPLIGTKLTGKLNAASNLADIASAATTRTNLGLGTAATASLSAFLQPGNNLSDLASLATALTNLGFATGAQYIKVPNPNNIAAPFIIQSAQVNVSATYTATFILPIAFPNQVLALIATPANSPVAFNAYASSLSQFKIQNAGSTTVEYNIIAIGN